MPLDFARLDHLRLRQACRLAKRAAAEEDGLLASGRVCGGGEGATTRSRAQRRIAEREEQIAASGEPWRAPPSWSWTDGKHACGSPSRTRRGVPASDGLCGHPMPAGEGIEKQFRSWQGLIDTRGKVSRFEDGDEFGGVSQRAG